GPFWIFDLVFSMITLGLNIAFSVVGIVLQIFTGISNSRAAEGRKQSSQMPPKQEEKPRTEQAEPQKAEPKTNVKQSQTINKEKVEEASKQQKNEHTSDWNILLFVLTLIPVIIALAAKRLDLAALITVGGVTIIIFYNMIRNAMTKAKQNKKQNEKVVKEVKKEDNELERVIKEAFDKVYAIRKELHKIGNQVIEAKIERLCDLAEKIIGEVRANPEILNSVRKFFYYYLDAFVEVFTKYLKLNNFGESSEELQKLLIDTEKSFDDMEEIFQELCEGMIEKDMLNLKATINVLKNSNYTN
ncbi:MAG: 5-bromo-4-chloroindolyl phosphate hydrolysis family protein, partial [Lutisporaceae bacterium]